MSIWPEVLDLYQLLDDATVTGGAVEAFLRDRGAGDVMTTRVVGSKGETDFVRCLLPGSEGKAVGGTVPTLGLVGRLGGIGARPTEIGFASDGDGALTVLAAALKIASMSSHGDQLPGDVIVATHICPNAPTVEHDPVPFMDSPVDIRVMNDHEVDPQMDAVLTIDATKANRVVNHNGFAISATVRSGWILKVSSDLLDVMTRVTGRWPVVLPLTMQDITPYGNGVSHINSIIQPATATDAPVVGVAITSEAPVGGSSTGATDLLKIEAAARFCVEVAKDFGRGRCRFYDREEYDRLVELYGSMSHLQGNERAVG